MTSKLKRYLLFSGATYYAAGGWKDFVDSYDTIEDALRNYSLEGFDWNHIVDKETGKIVSGEGRSHAGLGGYQEHTK